MVQIDHKFIEAQLDFPTAIGLMEQVLLLKHRGQTAEPLRTILDPTESPGRLFVMPAFLKLATASYYSVKLLGVFEQNPALGLSSRQGRILLSNGATGQTLAQLDAEAITYYRTAAMSAVATKLLTPQSSGSLAVIGTGAQAQHHLQAITTIRSIEEIKLVGRNLEKAKRIANSLQPKVSTTITVVPTIEAAVAAADIIVAATSSKTPILKYEWLKEGVHINSIGAVKPNARELDDTTIQNGKLFVDAAQSVQSETGDWLIPLRKGLITPESIVAEIGEVVVNPKHFEAYQSETTIFKSVGLSIEDTIMAQHIYQLYKAKVV